MANFKDDIIPWWESIWGNIDTTANWGLNLIDSVLFFIKDSIFGLLALITIGLLIYIWWRFIKADWNPEEMKKAFMNFVHIMIGLFIVAASFAIVKIVSGFNF